MGNNATCEQLGHYSSTTAGGEREVYRFTGGGGGGGSGGGGGVGVTDGSNSAAVFACAFISGGHQKQLH